MGSGTHAAFSSQLSTVDQLKYLTSVGFGCRKKEILNMPPSSIGPGIHVLGSAGQAHQTVPTANDSPPKRNAFRLTSGRYHPTANTLFRWKSWRRAAAHTGGAPLDGRERIPRYPSHSPHPATRISKGVLPSSECPSRLNRRSTQTHFGSTQVDYSRSTEARSNRFQVVPNHQMAFLSLSQKALAVSAHPLACAACRVTFALDVNVRQSCVCARIYPEHRS